MTSKQFQDLLQRARVRQDVILQQKGDDYTIDRAALDRLYNFKAIGELLDMSAEKVLLVYLFKHIFSIAAYAKSKKESEPITGRVDDAINYLYLLLGLIEERTPKYAEDVPEQNVHVA